MAKFLKWTGVVLGGLVLLVALITITHKPTEKQKYADRIGMACDDLAGRRKAEFATAQMQAMALDECLRIHDAALKDARR